MTDTELMREALALAKEAAADGEVPVGCVIARKGEIVGRGRNRREEGTSALAHAEIEDPGRLAAVGMRPLRDFGALPHVRRGHRECPDPPGGLRRQRR